MDNRNDIPEFPFLHKMLPSFEEMANELINYVPEEKVPDKAVKMFGYFPYNIRLPNGNFKTNLGRKQLLIVNDDRWGFKMNLISCHYTEEVRLLSYKKYTKISPIEYWNKNYSQVLDRANKLILTEDDIVHDLQRTDIFKVREILYRETKEVTVFKPTWIIAILRHFYKHETTGLKYLDISAGWADRLIIAILLNMRYTGFDPNELLQPCYNKIINERGNPDLHKVICLPFEDAELPDNEYDFVFSSPPFYDLELYTSHINFDKDGSILNTELDETQSTTRYTTFELWKNNFLFVSINKAVKALKPGGLLILYLSEQAKFRYIDSLFTMLEKEKQTKYVGCIGLSGVRHEFHPTWIWKKI